MYCNRSRIMGCKLKNRKTTFQFLRDLGYYCQFKLTQFVEYCQVQLILPDKDNDEFEKDIIFLNSTVDSEDLIGLEGRRIKKRLSQSKLDMSKLTHLTKGQFMIVYSIIVNEVGSFIALIECDELSDKSFRFGIYSSPLHFSVAMGCVAISMRIMSYPAFEMYAYDIECTTSSIYSSIDLVKLSIVSNCYPILKTVLRYNRILSLSNPTEVIQLAAASSDGKIKEWVTELNKKYDYIEILGLLDSNSFTQNQFIWYLNLVGFADCIRSYCTDIFSIRKFFRYL